MREIKFRCWDKDEKLMKEVNGINFPLSKSSGKDITSYNQKEDYYEWIYDYELMQYAGLKDKNGTEIYEGDIVRIKNEMVDWVGKVIFKDCKFCIEINTRYSTFWNSFEKITKMQNMNATITLHNSFEVIGNIYNNSNLLEE